MQETQTSQAGNSMEEKDVLSRLSDRRQPITKELLERFENGDLKVIPIHCVDGRPDEKEVAPYIQRLGGSFGYLVDCVGAGRQMLGEMFDDNHLQKIQDVVVSSFGQESFLYHSDDHHDDHCGCGFLKSVMNDPEAYNIKVSDWNEMVKLFPVTRRLNVCGEHKEVGVLVVDTPEFILKGNEQFFVFQRWMDNIALGHLSERVATALAVEKVEFLKALTNCRDANLPVTLKKLNADHLPVFSISQ